MDFIPVPPQATDITGMRFGKLTALGPVYRKTYPNGKSHLHWLCQCDCGRSLTLASTRIKNGHTRSCGCLNSEMASIRASQRNTSHGESRSPEYHAWCHMLVRCERDIKNYKSRGIVVCERWQKSLSDFIADVGRRPSPKHSLERIDNDGNYEPANVRWATKEEQMRNMRKTLMVTAFGRTQSLAAFFPDGSKWPAYDKAKGRIKMGWDHSRVVTMALLGR